MGRDIDATAFTPEERARYRAKVKADLAALRQLVEERWVGVGEPAMGLEVELYLVDGDGRPLPANAEVLDRLPRKAFQTELAQFNLEIDLPPQPLSGGALTTVENALRAAVDEADAAARDVGGRTLLIGILPTLQAEDASEANISANPRYRALNDAIVAARGEDITIRIDGPETLEVASGSIVFEAACTSLQLHLDVGPDDFARYWNAAQALAAPLVACGANSPLFLAHHLHHETRIALFEQAIDTRPEEIARQGVRPRVWFGERWLSEGVFELFDENVRYFPALLPLCSDEDPQAELAAGRAPELPELTLHNGTVYRWNRPVYAVRDGVPYLRIENRLLPAGPTAVDAMANAALFFGLIRALADDPAPVWERMAFTTAETNFFVAARDGLDAALAWPGVGDEVPAAVLIAEHLLPRAREGLRSWGIIPSDIDRLLGVVEGRAATRQGGAAWQIATFEALREAGADRHAAATEVVRRYAAHAASGLPVHTWER